MKKETRGGAREKAGRPFFGKEKRKGIQLTLDTDTLKKLAVLSEQEKLSKSKFIEKIISEYKSKYF